MTNGMALDKVLPKWTKKVTTDMGGRDPLGLSRISASITDYLLTGIITTTDRARYYSFYCWALWHIDMEEAPKKFQDFVDAFRRREAAIALATRDYNSETAPVGVVAASAQLQSGIAEKEVNCDFRVLPSNALGGYGQYYAGSLYRLGLTHRTEDGIDHVTDGHGEALARTFHTVVGKTPYIKKRLFRESRLPLRDLRQSERYLTIDALQEPVASEEREVLIEVFFGLNVQISDEKTMARRSTLAQILHIIREYPENGCYANTKDLDWYLVYPPYYYGVLWLSDDKTLPYHCPKAFDVCRSLWKQFCLQEFLIQAIEGIMGSLLEVVGGESAGLTIDEAVSRLLQPEFFAFLRDTTGRPCNEPLDLLLALGIDNVPNEVASFKIQKELTLLHPVSEAQILNIVEGSPQVEAARAISILSVLYCKWRGIKTDIGFNYVADNAGSELWTGEVFHYIDQWLKKETSWTDTLTRIMGACVVNQHDRIMYERRRLDSCWIGHSGERIFKEQDYGPRWRSSRHSNAVSILSDLGLVAIDDVGNLSITPEGQELVAKVLG